MSKCMIGMIAVALLICISATPAAAHGFLMINTGNTLPAGAGMMSLGDSTSFFLTATWESGTGIDDSWEIYGGLRFYASTADFRPYWGIYGFLEDLNDPITYSRYGIEGVYGCEWRYGKDFQICAFAEVGVSLAKENGVFVYEPVYGLGVGVSLWIF